MKTNIHLWLCLAHFFLEWEVFQTKVVKAIKTHLFLAPLFRKLCCFWDNVETYDRSRQTTDDIFFISNLIHCLLSTYNICYSLSSTCFRPHRPIIRRSKLYMQPMVFSPSADVFVVRPLRKSFLNGRMTKTSAEGVNTTGCMYNLDLLMVGLWGLKHAEERG